MGSGQMVLCTARATMTRMSGLDWADAVSPWRPPLWRRASLCPAEPDQDATLLQQQHENGSKDGSPPADG